MKTILIGVAGALVGASAVALWMWWYFKDVFR